MMKSIRISVLALTALVFPGFTAAGTDSAAPISADSPGPSSNPFSSDDVSKFDQVYAQFLRDHHTFLDIQGRFEGDKEKDFWFKCFEFHEPKLFALSEHLKETEELLRLSTKMGNPADEGHVLHSLMFPLSDAQSDIREIRPFRTAWQNARPIRDFRRVMRPSTTRRARLRTLSIDFGTDGKRRS